MVFQGPGRPPEELATFYIRPHERVLLLPGARDRGGIWISEVLPGVPDYFIGRTMALPGATGFRYSGRVIRTMAGS